MTAYCCLPPFGSWHAPCRINIRPVDAQRVALGAGQNGTLSPFRISVEDDQAVAERSCWLKMLDATVRHQKAPSSSLHVWGSVVHPNDNRAGVLPCSLLLLCGLFGHLRPFAQHLTSILLHAQRLPCATVASKEHGGCPSFFVASKTAPGYTCRA